MKGITKTSLLALLTLLACTTLVYGVVTMYWSSNVAKVIIIEGDVNAFASDWGNTTGEIHANYLATVNTAMISPLNKIQISLLNSNIEESMGLINVSLENDYGCVVTVNGEYQRIWIASGSPSANPVPDSTFEIPLNTPTLCDFSAMMHADPLPIGEGSDPVTMDNANCLLLTFTFDTTNAYAGEHTLQFHIGLGSN